MLRSTSSFEQWAFLRLLSTISPLLTNSIESAVLSVGRTVTAPFVSKTTSSTSNIEKMPFCRNSIRNCSISKLFRLKALKLIAPFLTRNELSPLMKCLRRADRIAKRTSMLKAVHTANANRMCHIDMSGLYKTPPTRAPITNALTVSRGVNWAICALPVMRKNTRIPSIPVINFSAILMYVCKSAYIIV